MHFTDSNNSQVVKEILPSVKELAADTSQYVRSVLASVAMELAPVLGKQSTIEHLLPVLLSLLKDDCPDVRLNIISKLDEVSLILQTRLTTPATGGLQALG